MIASPFRLVCLGLFLFLVTAVRVEAADLPDAGPVYVLEAFTTSCGVTRLFTMESRTLSSREMGPNISAWYLGNSYPRSRVGVNNFSHNELPTDGSCVTATVQSDIDGPFTVYMRPLSIVPESEQTTRYTTIALVLMFVIGVPTGFAVARGAI